MNPAMIARRRWIIGLPVALMGASIVVLATCCVGFLRQAAEGEVGFTSMWPLVLGTVGFLIGSMGALVLQGMELESRVVGPSQRIRRILTRVCEGDLTQRVHLRKGDLLGDLAEDVNHLIEWLNQNPPLGAVTGGDVLDIECAGDLVEDELEYVPIGVGVTADQAAKPGSDS